MLEELGLPTTDPSCATHGAPFEKVCSLCGLVGVCAGCSPSHVSHNDALLTVASAAAAQRAHLIACIGLPAQPGMLPSLDLSRGRVLGAAAAAAAPLPAAPVEAAATLLAEDEVMELMRSLLSELDELPGNTEAARQRALARRDDALALAGADEVEAAAAAASFDALLDDISHAEAVRARDIETDISAADAALERIQSVFGAVRRATAPDALRDVDLICGAYTALLGRVRDTFAQLRRLPSLRGDAAAIMGRFRGDEAIRTLLVAGAALLGRVRTLDLHVRRAGLCDICRIEYLAPVITSTGSWGDRKRCTVPRRPVASHASPRLALWQQQSHGTRGCCSTRWRPQEVSKTWRRPR